MYYCWQQWVVALPRTPVVVEVAVPRRLSKLSLKVKSRVVRLPKHLRLIL